MIDFPSFAYLSGYKLDENDYRDVKALCQKFNLDIPDEYAEFVSKEIKKS